mgnify:CR=1 FL=1|jgi:hypothetical protein
MKLNSNSTITAQPEGFLLDLKKHQLAILHSAKEIEKKFEIGFLRDRAGAGKTNIIIALVLNDIENKKNTHTIVVVPQNIHTQWVSEIKKMTGTSISVSSLTDYNSVSSLMFNMEALEADIIITTTLYYESIYSIIKQNGYTIRRTVYDEIDNMKDVMKNKDFKDKNNNKDSILFGKYIEGTGKSGITWYISASMDNLEDGEKTINIGGNRLNKEVLDKISLECEPEFLEASNEVLEEPEIITKLCISDIEIFTDYLSVDQLDALNSMNFKSISGGAQFRTALSEKDIINIIVENYLINIKRIRESITYKEKFKNKPEKLLDEITAEVKELNFFIELVSLIYSKLDLTYTENDTVDIFSKKLESALSNSKMLTKNFILEKIIEELSKTDKKILIFSDYQGSFDIAKKFLDKYSISNKELQGGNIANISETIEKYKNGDIRALLLDSESNSRGMNLENTGVVLFLHRTKEYMYNQITGRAQRPGRKGNLQIITILNENEVI